MKVVSDAGPSGLRGWRWGRRPKASREGDRRGPGATYRGFRDPDRSVTAAAAGGPSAGGPTGVRGWRWRGSSARRRGHDCDGSDGRDRWTAGGEGSGGGAGLGVTLRIMARQRRGRERRPAARRGRWPRPKVSTMIMRQPQHGHGGRWSRGGSGRFGRDAGLHFGHAEEFASPGEVGLAGGAGEQGGMRWKPFGRTWRRQAADELGGGQCHGAVALAAASAVVLDAEGHALVGRGDQPAVRYGDAVGVAAEVGEHRLRAGEGVAWRGRTSPSGAAARGVGRRRRLLSGRPGRRGRQAGRRHGRHGRRRGQ